MPGNQNGVPHCEHIGLQYWSALKACELAASEAAQPGGGDPTKINAACTLFTVTRNTLLVGGSYGRYARDCVLNGTNGGGPAHAGPPSWGFDYTPGIGDLPCKACP